MFSRNGKISEKQMRRMVVLSLYGSMIFVVPYLAVYLFGRSIVPGLIVFCGLALIYVTLIWEYGRWFQKYEVEKNVMRLLWLPHLVRVIVRLAFYVCLTLRILKEGQVPFMPKHFEKTGIEILVALPLFVICLYGAGLRREQQGRLYEMLFWLLFVPFVFVILFGLKRMDWMVVVPRFDMQFGNLVGKAYMLVPFLLPVENYLLLRPNLQKEENSRKTWFAVMGTVVLVMLLTLMMIGIYGMNGAEKDEMLTISIMRCIKLPFGLTERVDAFLIWFFLVGCFVLISQTLFFAGVVVKKLFPNGKRFCGMIVIFFTAIVLTLFLAGYRNALWSYRWFGVIVEVPLSLILPLLAMVGKREKSYE